MGRKEGKKGLESVSYYYGATAGSRKQLKLRLFVAAQHTHARTCHKRGAYKRTAPAFAAYHLVEPRSGGEEMEDAICIRLATYAQDAPCSEAKSVTNSNGFDFILLGDGSWQVGCLC